MNIPCSIGSWDCPYHACLTNDCQKSIVISTGVDWGQGKCNKNTRWRPANMNKARRKEIQLILDRIGEIKEELEFLKEAEETAYDNLPESLTETERAQTMQLAIDNLESAVSSLEDVENSLNETL